MVARRWRSAAALPLLAAVLTPSCAPGAATPPTSRAAPPQAVPTAPGYVLRTAIPADAVRDAREGRCGGLRGVYLELLQSPDSDAFAHAVGLRVRGDRVVVTFWLAPGTGRDAAADFARAHGFTSIRGAPLTSQEVFPPFLDAEVPVASLCAAARDPRVAATADPSIVEEQRSPPVPERR